MEMQSRTRLLGLARATGDGDFDVELASRIYGVCEPQAEKHPRSVAIPMQSFPRELMRTGATGTVPVLLRVAGDSKVEHAVATNWPTRRASARRAAARRCWRGRLKRLVASGG